MDEESKILQTITHPTKHTSRLSISIQTVSYELKEVMDSMIQDVEGTAAQFDDIVEDSSRAQRNTKH